MIPPSITLSAAPMSPAGPTAAVAFSVGATAGSLQLTVELREEESLIFGWKGEISVCVSRAKLTSGSLPNPYVKVHLSEHDRAIKTSKTKTQRQRRTDAPEFGNETLVVPVPTKSLLRAESNVRLHVSIWDHQTMHSCMGACSFALATVASRKKITGWYLLHPERSPARDQDAIQISHTTSSVSIIGGSSIGGGSACLGAAGIATAESALLAPINPAPTTSASGLLVQMDAASSSGNSSGSNSAVSSLRESTSEEHAGAESMLFLGLEAVDEEHEMSEEGLGPSSLPPPANGIQQDEDELIFHTSIPMTGILTQRQSDMDEKKKNKKKTTTTTLRKDRALPSPSSQLPQQHHHSNSSSHSHSHSLSHSHQGLQTKQAPPPPPPPLPSSSSSSSSPSSLLLSSGKRQHRQPQLIGKSSRSKSKSNSVGCSSTHNGGSSVSSSDESPLNTSDSSQQSARSPKAKRSHTVLVVPTSPSPRGEEGEVEEEEEEEEHEEAAGEEKRGEEDEEVGELIRPMSTSPQGSFFAAPLSPSSSVSSEAPSTPTALERRGQREASPSSVSSSSIGHSVLQTHLNKIRAHATHTKEYDQSDSPKQSRSPSSYDVLLVTGSGGAVSPRHASNASDLSELRLRLLEKTGSMATLQRELDSSRDECEALRQQNAMLAALLEEERSKEKDICNIISAMQSVQAQNRSLTKQLQEERDQLQRARQELDDAQVSFQVHLTTLKFVIDELTNVRDGPAGVDPTVRENVALRECLNHMVLSFNSMHRDAGTLHPPCAPSMDIVV